MLNIFPRDTLYHLSYCQKLNNVVMYATLKVCCKLFLYRYIWRYWNTLLWQLTTDLWNSKGSRQLPFISETSPFWKCRWLNKYNFLLSRRKKHIWDQDFVAPDLTSLTIITVFFVFFSLFRLFAFTFFYFVFCLELQPQLTVLPLYILS